MSYPTSARSRHFNISWLLIFSLASAVGCDSADYKIVQNQKSPSGQLSALLVNRRGHDSLSSDVFYLVVVDANAKLDLPQEIHKEPALVATHAEQLAIEWNGTGKDHCDVLSVWSPTDRHNRETAHRKERRGYFRGPAESNPFGNSRLSRSALLDLTSLRNLQLPVKRDFR
jgi:hypothetical protein